MGLLLLSSILIQGVLFTKSLLEIWRRKTLSNILICVISVALLLHLINIFTYHFINFNITFHVMPVVIISYGPLVYAYVTTLSSRTFKLPLNIYYSFIPVLVVTVIHIIGHEDYFSWIHIAYHAFIYLYSLAFLLASIYYVYTELARGRHKWGWTYHFLILIALLILFIAVDYVQFIASIESLKSFTTSGIVILGFTIALGSLLRSFLYPSIFNREEEGLKGNKQISKLFTLDQEQEMAETLTAHIKESKPYLSHDLTIRKLSQQVDIPPHVLSWLINKHFQQSFVEFINSYRIEEAKHLLNQSTIKILAVALESGFSNKTSFNRTFKKLVGMAPSEYRNNS